MQRELTVTLCGAGGYGAFYLDSLLGGRDPRIRLTAVVETRMERCAHAAQLERQNIPVFGSLAEARSAQPANLVIICSPIHHHASQAIEALKNGSHILCEKPLCATVQDGISICEAAGEKIAAVGYQWSYSAAIQDLKTDILAGAFGAPRRCKSLVLWPRDHAYYARNCWAGKVRAGGGALVLDSPLNNAAAHFLHNLLYLLGPSVDQSAAPDILNAELYRVNDIENFDTACVRCTLENNVDVLFLTSHATRIEKGPAFEIEFDTATISYARGDSCVIAELDNGAVRRYGSPDDDPYRKLTQTVSSILGESQPLCPARAALPHVVCVNAAQESHPIADLPASMICVAKNPEGQERLFADGLGRALEHCYDHWELPSGQNNSWASAGKQISCAGYERYPSANKS